MKSPNRERISCVISAIKKTRRLAGFFMACSIPVVETKACCWCQGGRRIATTHHCYTGTFSIRFFQMPPSVPPPFAAVFGPSSKMTSQILTWTSSYARLRRHLRCSLFCTTCARVRPRACSLQPRLTHKPPLSEMPIALNLTFLALGSFGRLAKFSSLKNCFD
jgi:hypothetical protein